jgi:exosome complex exonuclease DIS3/RRP44
VLRETRHRSLPLYNRLHALVNDEERCVWVWWNEERRETATIPGTLEGGVKEGPNDQNDRAIRQSLHFYADHLAKSSPNPPTLILLSDDRRNREIAKEDGLVASNTKDYVDGLVGDVREALVDLVVGGVDELEPGERRGRRIYDEVRPQSLNNFPH